MHVPIVNHRICLIGDPQRKVVLCRKQIERLNLNVDQILPLHGRVVPVADLHTMVGHGH